MKRRDFIKNVLATGGVLGLSPRILSAGELKEAPADPAIKRVLVMFKCHFDAGFIDTQANVVSWYLDLYFPDAIETAAELRQRGDDGFIWTTGSWLLYQYLEKADSTRRKQMEQAIAAGDIAWHAIPFTWQTEFMDSTLIAGALSLSATLDRRFGRTTTGAKMTDVCGHTRGLIGPLAEHGVKLLDIGANAACTVPDVPPVFRWKNSDDHELIMLYHADYGGIIKVPGSDLAIDVEMKGDNDGPHSIGEVHAVYSSLRDRFPDAQMT